MQNITKGLFTSLGVLSSAFAFADAGMAGQKSASAAAQPQMNQGDPVKPGQLPAGYNQSARWNPNGKWDAYVTAAWICWTAQQDGLDTGYSVELGTEGAQIEHESDIFYHHPRYESGFKVGLGFNTASFDDWSVYAEYTRYHAAHGTTHGVDGNEQITNSPYNGVMRLNNGITNGRNVHSRWSLEVDILDASIQRPYYLGTRLTINPFFGLRAAWVEQHFNMFYDQFQNSNNRLFTADFNFQNHTKNWQLGPRLGMEGSWLLGCGFKVIGNGSVSLLYTRYTEVKREQHLLGLIEWEQKYHKNYHVLSPMLELDAGLGWGTYFSRERFHFDFAATYDFISWWNQRPADPVNDSKAMGTLYLHGVTLKGRFDF